MGINKILVVCTGNTCRSPMVEGIINKIIADEKIQDVKVTSMGLSAYDGEGATQYAIDVMKEIDIDISKHESKRVMLQDIVEADKIYVMTLQHQNVILEAFPPAEEKIVVMNISDPFGLNHEKYQQCRDSMLEFFDKEKIEICK